MALSDSAVHLIGADYLIHHGQSYAHLDLRNSYGQFLHNYYATGYPSGADTLFGGSALLLRLPLIWAFQPFIALMLAFCSGPAWLLARALGLRGAWAAPAALSATRAGARLRLRADRLGQGDHRAGDDPHARRARRCCTGAGWRARRCAPLPIALVLGAGVSALGVGFGAWALAAAACCSSCSPATLRAGRAAPPATLRDGSRRRARAARRRVADLDARVGVAARRAEHRLDRQRRQPAGAAEMDAGVRRVAARQLQAAARRRAGRRSRSC